ncbi:MAG: thermonuclease family protein [Nitrosopumilaceae archaeon]
MKTAVVAAILAGVAVVAFIGVFVGIGSNQAEKPNDYQRELEESVSSESNKQAEEQTDYQKTLEEAISSESNSPFEPKEAEKIQILSNDCSGGAGCFIDYVTRIIDGDTFYTDTLKIRLSLTNTPEINQAGYSQATQFTEKLCPVGSKILVDQDDLQPVDVYGRVLAKVSCGNKVLNSELLYNGYANILTQYCTSSEFSGEAWAQKYGCGTKEIQSPTPSQTKENSCDPSYPDFCIPPPPPDLDCKDIPQKRFTVLQPDPHGFDGDKDGIGCES